MRRKGSMWAYSLSVLLGAVMTIALLPACGSSGGDSCNSFLSQSENEADQELCDAEEGFEETEEGIEEVEQEFREETGILETVEFTENEELFREFTLLEEAP